PRSSSPLRISEEQQTQIEHWLAAMGTPQQVALRCRIVLAAATGRPETAIAAETSTNRKTVRLWKERFAAQGYPACGRSLLAVAVSRRTARPRCRTSSTPPSAPNPKPTHTGAADSWRPARA